MIAGRRIIKLGNVAQPQIHVFQPPPEKANGTSVVVCPGGGFSILAGDLEGTEVADWLNAMGVTGIVLKYRVPTRNQEPRWLASVQDTQRAVSLVRSKATEWNLDPDRIGVLGFSAGGAAAALTSLFEERKYPAVDKADETPFQPDFSVLIYPGALANEEATALNDFITVTENAPPTFFAHAFDDRVRLENSVLLFLEFKKLGIPSELHVYDAGGHGYGLRPVNEFPVTTWTKPCEDWMRRNGWLK